MNNPFEPLLKQGLGKAPLNVEQASIMFNSLLAHLQQHETNKQQHEHANQQIWATQSQLAKRLGYKSTSEICRIIATASRDGHQIESFPCGNNQHRYKISSFENYLQTRKLTNQ